MKLRFIGIFLLAVGLLIGPVSFASDGPPTAKDAFSDVNHTFIFVADIDVSDFVIITYEKSGTAAVHDVGKFIELSFDIEANTFGLPSNFNWEAYSAVTWPYYNEWLIYEDYISFVAYQEPYLGSDINRSRCNC